MVFGVLCFWRVSHLSLTVCVNRGIDDFNFTKLIWPERLLLSPMKLLKHNEFISVETKQKKKKQKNNLKPPLIYKRMNKIFLLRSVIRSQKWFCFYSELIHAHTHLTPLSTRLKKTREEKNTEENSSMVAFVVSP